jgi:hypothetical protein
MPPSLPVTCAAVLAAVLASWASAAAQQTPAVPVSRFAGTWVGTQAWAIETPPPGARQDQPVTLTIDVVDGAVTGSMKPFLGSDEGATFIEATIVGEELHASAVIGRPRTAGRRGGPPGWKDSTRVRFVFRGGDLNMSGAADVTLGDVPWMKFTYTLGKKRARY